jgi:hypothetical protein
MSLALTSSKILSGLVEISGVFGLTQSSIFSDIFCVLKKSVRVYFRNFLFTFLSELCCAEVTQPLAQLKRYAQDLALYCAHARSLWFQVPIEFLKAYCFER